MAPWLRFSFLLFLCVGCNTDTIATVITVSETAGLDRDVEYITTTLSLKEQLKESEMLLAIEQISGKSILIQVSETIKSNDGFELAILFPVSIAANQTKKFEIRVEEKMQDVLPIQLLLSEDQLTVENSYYQIHFSHADDKRGGQVNGIMLKNFNNLLLKRGHIAMHWAPNFSKIDSESYFNMEDLSPNSENVIERQSYRILKRRSGITDSVPEIQLEGLYEFFADVPYFLFESSMTMNDKVVLNLLRNDEMTMDSLFTHVAYPKKDKSIVRLKLYNEELDVLEDHPISDSAEWVAFYNQDKGYGIGSLRLDYDNTNVEGGKSPTHNPYTKISRASGNGRYWNRVLADTTTTFPKGSQYQEKNAYLIFEVDHGWPEKELLRYNDCLRNPLKVSVH